MTDPHSLHPARRDELLRCPRLKPKLLTLNLLTAFFFVLFVFYAGIFYSGVLGSPASRGEDFVWIVLAVLSVLMAPVMVLMGSLCLKRAEQTEDFEATFQMGLTTVIVTLSFGETAAIFGLVSVFFGATPAVSAAILFWGLVLLAGGLLWIRPRVLDLIVVRLDEEEKRSGKGS